MFIVNFLRVLMSLGWITLVGRAALGAVKNHEKEPLADMAVHCAIGGTTNFLDALGIGCFGPAMSVYRLSKKLPDEKLVPTLNAGMPIAAFVEGLIYITVIEVEPMTLIALVIFSVLGGFISVSVANRANKQTIQSLMGIALIVAAFFILSGKMGWTPVGGDEIGLHGIKLVIGCIGNFILGILLCFGIGNYAPCMAMVYMLGLSPAVAFPVMCCSACLCCYTSGMRYMSTGKVNRTATVCLGVTGSIGVLIAVYIVKSMSLDVLQWLVIAVLIYTALTLFRDAARVKKAAA